MKVYAIGASRNIGYYVAVRLLGTPSASTFTKLCIDGMTDGSEKGATVTFLLRSTTAFDNDERLQKYKESGYARLVQGDALKAEDIARGWEVAQEGPDPHIDLVLFTLGGFQRRENIDNR